MIKISRTCQWPLSAPGRLFLLFYSENTVLSISIEKFVVGIVNKTLWLWESWPHIKLAIAGILSTIMIKIKYNFILISCLINNSSCSGFRNLCECLSLSRFLLILIPCHDTGGDRTGETRFRAQIWGENCVNNLSRTPLSHKSRLTSVPCL